MPNNVKKVLLQKKIDGSVYDILVKSSADIVAYTKDVSGTPTDTTVAAELAALASAISGVSGSAITENQVKSWAQEISDNTYNQIMGITEQDGASVNEAYDTLKEVANFLAANDTIAEAFSGKLANMDAINTLINGVEADPENNVEAVPGLASRIATLEAGDYSKVTSSTTNGNIKVDNVEMTVFDPAGTGVIDAIVESSTRKFMTPAEKTTVASAAAIKYVQALPADASTISENDLYLVDLNPSVPSGE